MIKKIVVFFVALAFIGGCQNFENSAEQSTVKKHSHESHKSRETQHSHESHISREIKTVNGVTTIKEERTITIDGVTRTEKRECSRHVSMNDQLSDDWLCPAYM